MNGKIQQENIMMLMKLNYRTTLDIDNNNKEFIGRILEKIGSCKNFNTL